MSGPESKIEKQVRLWAEARGWLVWKFTSPGKRGVPDRFFLRKGRVVFIEMKAEGEEPTIQQERRHKNIREHGGEVYWTDSLEKAKQWLT